MAIGNYYSTPENYEEAGERDLHIDNTRFRGKAIDFWMFNPPLREGDCLIRCGICKQGMDGHKHCPNCYPEKEAL